MQTRGLFHDVLIAPALTGADRLVVVSGYATPSLFARQASALGALGCHVSTSVVVGMAGETGVAVNVHQDWSRMLTTHATLEVRYTIRGVGDHSKTYIWFNGDEPALAWTGSANYTETGFALIGGRRIETLTPVDPRLAHEIASRTLNNSASALDAQFQGLVDFYSVDSPEVRVAVGVDELPSIGIDQVVLPLVQLRNGEVHNPGAGLNWGQRGARRRAEAYIPVPHDVQVSGFFPPVGVPFDVVTDDGERIRMIRAQQNGKALHSTEDNSIVGRYFRRRLGLSEDAMVETADLHRYGRTSVTMTRLRDGVYRLDFRPDYSN